MKIGIAVFSGTGNTAYVAETLASALASLGAEVNVHHIDESACREAEHGAPRFNAENYDLFGIGHPVLGFGPTPLVLDFARSLSPGHGRVFIFKSAADSHAINNSASEHLIRIVQSKGHRIVHDFLYIMPCNWAVSYQRSFNLQIIDTVREKATSHARDLVSGTIFHMPVKWGWRRLAMVLHFLESRYGRRYFGRSLRVTDDCTQCGLCVDNCPVRNIREEEQRIVFGAECLWCMRCIYSCPSHAIDAGWLNWCAIEGGYRLSDYLEDTGRDRTFITNQSRGFWKHFQEYFLPK